MITYTFNLDVVPGGVPVIVPLTQYEDDFMLQFRMFSSQGDLSLPSGTTVAIRGMKPDGNGYSANTSFDPTPVDFDDGTVTVEGDVQMTAAAGKSWYELVFKKDSKTLCTARFVLAVERAAMDHDTFPSESVIKELFGVPAGLITALQEILRAASYSSSDVSALIAGLSQYAGQSGGSGGTGDHSQLTNRNALNQHPMIAITGLQAALDNCISEDETVEAETVNLSDVASSGSYNDLVDKLTAGENIHIDENNVISAEGGEGMVFNVVYQTTMFSDIKSANDAGKICRMKIGNVVYYLTSIDSSIASFVWTAQSANKRIVTCTSSNVWSEELSQSMQLQDITDPGSYFSTDTVEGALQELGAAKLSPESKTSAMTQPVGVDTDGKLYTAPGGSVTPAKLLDVTVENASEFQQNVDLSGYNNFLIVIGGKKNDAAVSISTGRIYRNHNEYYIGYYTSFLPAGSSTYPVGCIVENIRFFDEDSFIGDYVQYSTEIAPSAKTWQGQGSSNPQPKTAIVTKNSVKPNEQDKISIQLSAEIESLTVKIFGY